MTSAGWLDHDRGGAISSRTERSVARLTSEGELIRPVIEVANKYITVSHTASPYSRVTATKLKALDQSGRDFILRKEGRHEIIPGKYQHIVLGKMMSEGSVHGPPPVAFIESKITYY
jgi:hypothetical protein